MSLSRRAASRSESHALFAKQHELALGTGFRGFLRSYLSARDSPATDPHTSAFSDGSNAVSVKMFVTRENEKRRVLSLAIAKLLKVLFSRGGRVLFARGNLNVFGYL